ncbi:sugar phosphate isomerase/epimerase family protein [Pararhizobium gei]|uniref:sugar phosphate isomerase/epimerase family protein n=1 Tax=Pararhizobium gei TaxID=1395951 RepID=UPI0023D98D4C|nr:sugar phosphate isomerase/epimerase [Rhizobium gei]
MSLDHKLSFQLYSAREFPPLGEQLKTLSALGFTNVEPYGDLYEDLAGFKVGLQANGLSADSGHFDLAMLESQPERAIEIATALGMKNIIAPWLDPEDRPVDAAGWKALGDRLETLNGVFTAAGFKFGWHNHDFEFTLLDDGSMPIEHLLGGNGVGLELDVAWVVRAGIDPLPWISRYSDRLLAVHVKDIAPAGENLDQDGWAHLGQGVVDWKAIWPAVAASSARVAVLEHDQPADWRRFAQESAAALLSLQAN